MESLYDRLVGELRRFVGSTSPSGLIVGLSGGVDSALCTALAVDAVGSQSVKTFFLSSEFSSKESRNLSEEFAANLGVFYQALSIKEAHHVTREILNVETGVVDENLQARIRGMILMGISNRDGGILVCTGNKSELAMGYCTLYGDTCGGFAPIGDVYKTQVYELCRFRNEISYVIPEEILCREPTAELAPNQRDSDAIPRYKDLDKMLFRFIERGEGPDENCSGVEKMVWKRLLASEYKRHQLPPYPKVSSRCFADWKVLRMGGGSS